MRWLFLLLLTACIDTGVDMAGGVPLIIKGQASGGAVRGSNQNDGPGSFNRPRGNFGPMPTPATFATDYIPVLGGGAYTVRVVVRAPVVPLGFTASIEWSNANKVAFTTEVPISALVPADIWSAHSAIWTAPPGAKYARLLITHAIGNELIIDACDLVSERALSESAPRNTALANNAWTTIPYSGPAANANAGLRYQPGGTTAIWDSSNGLLIPQSGMWEFYGRVTVKSSGAAATLVAKVGLNFFTFTPVGSFGAGSWSAMAGVLAPMEGPMTNNTDPAAGVISQLVVAHIHLVMPMGFNDAVKMQVFVKDGAGTPTLQNGTGDNYLFARLVSSI